MPFVSSLTVGGLLQTKFMSGGAPFGNLPEVPFGGILQKLSKPAVSEALWSSSGPSFFLQPPAPEVTLRSVGARMLEAPMPRKISVTLGKGRLLMDAALYMGRSFRVGWGPNWTLVHCGEPLSTAQESKEQVADTMGFGFLPKPTKTRQ